MGTSQRKPERSQPHYCRVPVATDRGTIDIGAFFDRAER
jgi:hypothetical protein